MSYGSYPDLSRVNKILVIKLRQLGDVLLSSPVWTVLRGRFPQAQIDLYLYREAFPLVKGDPAINRLIGYDRSWKDLSLWKRLRKEWAIRQEIGKGGYDLVLNLTEGDRGAFAAKWSQAGIRVGFEPKGRWQKGFYTHLVKSAPGLRHMVERNLDPLRKIGLFPSLEERELSLPIEEAARRRVGEWINGPFILIHPTSRWRFKCWPKERMRELAIELLKRGKKVVFTSGPDPEEQEMVSEITRGLDLINLSGRVTLQELAALIEATDLLICVDSLPFHIASALKKRVIALFGPTSEVTWGPWRNPKAHIVTQPFPCRPCYMDGCGGSKRSDCLTTLPLGEVIRFISLSGISS